MMDVQDVNLSGRVMIVTGANSGVGKATAQKLAEMGAEVIMMARDRRRGAAALADVRQSSGNPNVHLMLCDLSSLDSIERFAAQFRQRFERLDILINNAGVFLARREESVDGLELSLVTNHLGHFWLTLLLLDMLKASAPARIINVSSDAHRGQSISFDNLQRKKGYGLMRVYGETKLMNILFTYELNRRLEGSGVTVNAMHPGFVRSNFGRNNFGLLGQILMPLIQLVGRSAEKGAETVVYLASDPDLTDVSGKYFVDKRAVRSSKASYDQEAQRRLWQVSETLLARNKPEVFNETGAVAPA
ncbi:MAG: SDR family oxidoreductase [Candidatus Promineifilaceae bacterium]|nr:SDR family oxidoreductase [Candidatus Promineifilaceae bacterium]